MVKLLKKARQSQDGPETRPLPCNSQVVNAKKTFIKEIKSAPPLKSRMRREQNSLTADMENVSVVWMRDHKSYDTTLGQSLIQSKALACFKSIKAERGEEAAGKNGWKPVEVGSWVLRKEAIFVI